METTIPDRLSALGHPQRLALFRLLMRRYPDRVPATELARALSLKPNTLSTYVNALMQVGLLTQERAGTSLRYAIDMDSARDTMDFLFRDCCRGRPEICTTHAPAGQPEPERAADRKYHVLFVCTGNSARSIFAESILRDAAGDRFVACSAGTEHGSELNPFALDVLALNGHDVSVLRPKNIAEFQGDGAPDFDFVFTVCDLAANEECPPWPGQPISGHWGLPDPAKVEGTKAEKNLVFHQTYGALQNRIAAFAALPFASLDRISLQRAVDQIGQTADTGAR
ncbi:MAG: helix-turn-helix domain-containing protein [Pseudomonadota bacterium]